MKLNFYKYHGAGNDFILLDNRNGMYDNLSDEQREFLCNRHLGIGADGLMLLQNADTADFEMVYCNSDGRKASMCGNGGRCIVAFAKQLNIIHQDTCFTAYDGLHSATVVEWDENKREGVVKLKMELATDITKCLSGHFVDTGSPHYVEILDEDVINSYNVVEEGRKLRNNNAFAPNGTNVDFINPVAEDTIRVATYERGVEDETLSCGTGVVASALIWAEQTTKALSKVYVKTKGGDFEVSFQKNTQGKYENIYLQGPVSFVFEGTIEV